MSRFSSFIVRTVRWLGRLRPVLGPDPRLLAMQGYLASQVEPDSLANIASWARMRHRHSAEMRIDPHENEFRAHPEGLELRAWCLIPHEDILSMDSPSTETMSALASMAPLTLAIFLLRVRHGIPSADIAQQFNISRWTVRRHIRLAIRAIAQSIPW